MAIARNVKPLIFLLLVALISGPCVNGQERDTVKTTLKSQIKELPILGKQRFKFNYNIFSQFYPIHENPTVGWRSALKEADEVILFDFHPTLTTSFFNNFKKRMQQKKLLSMGYYFSFRPHFRMYHKNSTPVQMPSYRIFLGLQHMYRLDDRNLISYALESGHYSNGQPGCSLAGGGEDQSATCDSVYALVNDNSNLSEMINRVNGDFSTNLTQFTVNYRRITHFDEYSRPQQVHSTNIGIVRYHDKFLGLVDAGGYSDHAIKMYGYWRFLLSYNYSYNWKSGYRMTFSEDIEIIQGAHPWVNPVRAVTTASFFLPRNLGLYISYIYGHDDYNLRFVDSGHQFGVGLVWDMFPPDEILEN
jgi:hypothetical protein